MGLFDKLKNVFFEEEYIEVEEEPIKKEKVTVAKRIETPEIKKAKEEAIKKEIEEKQETEEVAVEKEPEHKFPMNFDDADFEVEEKVVEKKEEPPVKEEQPVIQIIEEKIEYKEEYNNNYNYNYNSNPTNNYHGLYEGSDRKEKSSGFKPSPIISPIYGVLDKNYKKEEIVTKKEIRLSAASSKKVDLDRVREKAYGDLATDISDSIDENVEDVEEKEENLLYDLNEDDSPAVKVVTMGDAEEYFNDLGLEYNVDYKVEKDKPKEEEIPIARRSERNIADLEDLEESEEQTENDSNLFDLIESMYEDKE